MINDLHHHGNCTAYVHGLLDIIENDMLIVLSTDQHRAGSPVLLEKFEEMHRKCLNQVNYCMEKTPDPERLVRVPTGTRARLASEAYDMVEKNNMKGRLTMHRLEDGKRYHQSLSAEDFKKINLHDDDEGRFEGNRS
jgi:hypothetical protein